MACLELLSKEVWLSSKPQDSSASSAPGSQMHTTASGFKISKQQYQQKTNMGSEESILYWLSPFLHIANTVLY